MVCCRGSYYGWNSEDGVFQSSRPIGGAGGGVLRGNDYHYDWSTKTYVNRFGQPVSFPEVNYSYIIPNQTY